MRRLTRTSARGRAVGTALAVTLLLGGCATGDTGDAGETPSGTVTGTTSAPPETEEPAPTPSVETQGQVEPPVEGGDDKVAIELAGLPVGGGASVDVDGTWCQVLFWGEGFPAGVSLEVTRVEIVEGEGTLRVLPCEGYPPCVQTVLDADHVGCTVAVTPPSPTADRIVVVRLDGTLTCPDQATCDELRPTGSTPPTSAIEPPPGWGSSPSPEPSPDTSPEADPETTPQTSAPTPEGTGG
jgi:hypothetical protein